MGEPADAAPRIVGRYAIFDEIASGGMATVYLGRLMGSGGFARTVAIKRLHPQFAKNPEFVAMFLDEARLAARIRHPNVVPTLDVVAASGELFHVMEYVQGESLSHLARGVRSRDERIPLPILMRVMNDVLQGLHAAHEARDERGVPLSIVHRDVTPQNILVGVDGVARLLDFGVAKAAGRAQTTQDGQIKGKLAYMAPEQLMSAGVTRETDLYAASVVFWEMLAGERLFSGESELDVVAKLLQRRIEPPSRFSPGVPHTIDALVMRGLAAKIEDRFATAREMAVALGTCGVPEASSLDVGAWVERFAAQSLAYRTARVAAIEAQSEGEIASSGTVRAMSASSGQVTVVEGPVRGSRQLLRSDLRTGDGFSDALSVTMSASVFRRRARLRVAVVAVILALVGTGVLAATVHRLHSLASAPVIALAPRPGNARASSGAPLDLPTPPDVIDSRSPSVAPLPASAVPTAVSSASLLDGAVPASRKRAPSAASSRARPTPDDRVFESRE
jgi:serine/threonine-protein kinase